VARLLPRRSFSNRYIRSLLRPGCPERFPNQLTASPTYHSHPKFSSSLSITLPRHLSKCSPFCRFFFLHNHPKFSSFFLSHNDGICNSWSGRCSHISGTYSVRSFFLRFGGGLPLHKVHILSLPNQLEVSFACFTISSLKVFPSILSDVLLILRRSCRLV
jgi:hypothetical protein